MKFTLTQHPPLNPCLSLGVEKKLDDISQLKVKGLVLGPLHTVQTNNSQTLDLETIDPVFGNKEQLVAVLEKAHKKGRSSYN